MNKTILALSTLFISGAASAQITLHGSDFPNANDSVLTSIAATSPADPALTGANYNWDFSALTPTLQRYDKFDAPSTFPSIYAFLFSAFTTTYGQDNYTFTSLPIPGVTISSAYNFYKKNTGDLRQTGAGYVVSGTPIPFLYSSPDIQYKFPMSYLNTDSCNFKFGLPIPGLGYYGETGHRVNTVDGWGNLTTPFGTFSTLRVKSVLTTIDTVYITAFSTGSSLPARTMHQYKWFATGMKVPVLEVDALVTGSTETVSTITYQDSTRSVPQVGITEYSSVANLQVYPNPSSEQAMIRYSLKTSANVKISISNLPGQTIAVVANDMAAAGSTAIVIDVKVLGLTPGIYFVNFESNGLREVKKLVVGK